MYILGGTASVIISEELSKILRAPLAKTISKRFPDEEFYFRILDDIKNKAVVIVQTTYPDPNLVELFLIQNAAEEAGAKKITVVIPYFGYARQDTKFQEGEAVSAKALARLISLNADEVITIDPHKEHILDFFSTKAKSGTAVPEIASYLKEKNIDMVLAPDKGAKNRAKRAAEIINCDFDYMQKTRIDGSTVEMKPKQLDAKNKTVAIIDDIISTGGTMALAIKELKGQGAKKVFVACTHGLFASDAIKKLSSAGCDEIISTDTIQNEYSTVHTASCIAKVIKGK
jgi:ribose-phosphate pyrophosphokinase